MTEESIKDLVLKHDATISGLANSVQHQATSIEALVASNGETNKRLEEISKYLAKQAVFDSRLESLNRELEDSFHRVHARIDSLEGIQNSTNGCNSVQLLGKDVSNLEKEHGQMYNALTNIDNTMHKIDHKVDELPSPSAMKWVAGLLIVYLISFGSYVVTEIQHERVDITRITEHISK